MARTSYLPHAAHVPVDAPLTVSTVVAGYCALAFWLALAVPPLRILAYAIPPLALIAALSVGRLSMPPHGAPYLVLMLVGVGYAPVTPLAGWQDLYLMLTGLAPFAFAQRWRVDWRLVFAAAVAATVLAVAAGRGSSSLTFDPSASRSFLESTTSFVFGMLAVWAALERRWGRVLLALLLCVLTLKRIVVLASFAVILVLLLPHWITDRLLRPLPMLLLNAGFIWLTIGYTQGHFDRLIFEWTLQSGNQFGMGRQALYALPVAQLVANPWESLLHGVGPGGVYDLLRNGWAFLGKANLHNDSLKILVEYGGIAWAAFFVAMYWRRRWEERVVMLFLNIVFLTDNTLIYSSVSFTVGLTLCCLRDAAATGPPPEGPGRRAR